MARSKSTVRSASKSVTKVASKANDILNKTPVVGTIKQKITFGIAYVGKKVDKVPVIGTVKRTVTTTIGKVTDKVPIIKDVKKGVHDVTDKKKAVTTKKSVTKKIVKKPKTAAKK